MIADSRGQLHATERDCGRLLTAASICLRVQGAADEWARGAPEVTFRALQNKSYKYQRVAIF